LSDEQILDFSQNFTSEVLPALLSGFDELEQRMRRLGAASAGGEGFDELARRQRAMAEQMVADIRRIAQEYAQIGRAGGGLGEGQRTFASQLQQELRGAQQQSVELTRQLGAGLGPELLAPLGRGFSEVFTRVGQDLRAQLRTALTGTSEDLRRVFGSANQFQPVQAARAVAGPLAALTQPLPAGPVEPVRAPVVAPEVRAGAAEDAAAFTAIRERLAAIRQGLEGLSVTARAGTRVIDADPQVAMAAQRDLLAARLRDTTDPLRLIASTQNSRTAQFAVAPNPSDPTRNQFFYASGARAGQQVREPLDLVHANQALRALADSSERAARAEEARATRAVEVARTPIGPSPLTPAEIERNQRAVQVAPNPIGPALPTPADQARAVAEAEQVAAEATRAANLARLQSLRGQTANLRQAGTGAAVETPAVTQVGPGHLVDVSSGIARAFDLAGNELLAGSREYNAVIARFDRQLERAATEQERAAGEALANRNLTALQQVMATGGDVSRRVRGQDVTMPAVGQLDARTLVDSRLPDPRFFTLAGRELVRGSERYNAAISSFDRQLERASTQMSAGGGGITGAFTHGLLSGGFGGGPQGALGLAQSAGTTVKYTALYQVMGLLQGALTSAAQEVLNFEDSQTELAVTLGVSSDAIQGQINDLEKYSVIAGANVGDIMDVAARGARAFGDTAGIAQAAAKGPEAYAEALKKAQGAGDDYAREASRMAVIANTDLKDAAGNMSAIGQSFDIPAAGLARINDAVSLAKSLGGGDAKETAQGLASIGTAAQAAGFSLEQAAVLVGRVQTRTDETGAAVGNKLSRIVSIASGANGQQMLAQLVPQSQNASAADQLIALANAWEKLTDAQKKQATNTFGGTASPREFLAAMNALRGIDGTDLNSAGKSAEEYQRRLQDLTRQLAALRGEASALAVNLGRSGLLAPIEGMLGLLQGILVPLNGMLQTWDRLPGSIRNTVGSIVAVGLALKAVAAVQAGGGLMAMMSRTEEVVAPGRVFARRQLAGEAGGIAAGTSAAVRVGATAEETVATQRVVAARTELAAATTAQTAATQAQTAQQTAAGQRVVVAQAELAAATQTAVASTAVSGEASFAQLVAGSGTAGAAGRGGGLLARAGATRMGGAIASAGSALGGAGMAVLSSPITWAIGGLIAVGQIKDHADQLRSAMDAGSKGLMDLGGSQSANDYKNAASSLAAAAEQAKSAGSGPFGFLAGKAGGNQAASTFRFQSDFAAYTATQLAAQDKVATGLQKMTVFGDPAAAAADTLSAAMKSLTDSGMSAEERVKLLDRAFASFGSGANTGAPVNKRGVAANAANSLTSISGGDIGIDLGPAAETQIVGGASLADMYKTGRKELAARYRNVMSSQEKAISDALTAALPDFAAGPGGQLSDGQKNAVVEKTLAAAAPGIEAEAKKQHVDFQELMDLNRKKLLEFLSGKVGTTLAPGEKLSGEQIFASVNEHLQGMEQAISMLLPGDTQGQVAKMREGITFINSQVSHAKAGDPVIAQMALQKAKIEAQIAQLTLADSEKERQSLQNAATSKAQIRAIGDRFLVADINTAIAGRNAEALIGILNKASVQEITAVRATIEGSIAVIDAAIAAAQETARAAIALGGEAAGLPGHSASQAVAGAVDKNGNLLLNQRKKEQDALAQLDAARRRSSPKTKTNESVYGSGLDSGNPLGNTETAAQVAAAAAAARAAGSGSDIAAARAAVQTARADVANATKGTVAYYSALGQLYSAQRQLRDAIGHAGSARDSAEAARVGGALATSAAQVRAAKVDLSLAAKGTAAYYQALGQLYSAQQQYAEALRSYQKMQWQLASDLTDPVKAAQIDARAAAAKLAQDRKRGAGKDVLAQDQLDLRSAQNTAEAAAFNQRLQDAQTAEQLGRMSHAAYMSYLQSEHNRLSAVKQRTRQQQDELNQIDLAMKEAAKTASGQFNLGSTIKLPTVYQVRRYIQETAGAAKASAVAQAGAAMSAGAMSSTTIHVDGTDTGMVLKILGQYLGPQALGSVSVSTNRKV
jgi:hypothetical protein